MPADLYSDADMSAAPAAQAEPAEPEAPETEEYAQGGETAEIPKSLTGGMDLKPGDTVTLRVVQVGENSLVVESPGTEEAEEPAEPAPTEPATAPAPGSMAELMG